jgi:hypothetical protein
VASLASRVTDGELIEVGASRQRRLTDSPLADPAE